MHRRFLAAPAVGPKRNENGSAKAKMYFRTPKAPYAVAGRQVLIASSLAFSSGV
jgi:hypothetical protein